MFVLSLCVPEANESAGSATGRLHLQTSELGTEDLFKLLYH
uniref:Uncharacterized protein n=1 Tax=Anguilla anguilla TaxID=7936 RepID=A0A0E9RIP7_ANGAN